MRCYKFGRFVIIDKATQEKDKKHEGGGGYYLSTNRKTKHKTHLVWLPYTQIVVEASKVHKYTGDLKGLK